MKFKRIFLIVLDSVGAGESTDAKDYNDTGANTLKHASFSKKNFKAENLESLGLGLITEVNNCSKDIAPKGIVGRLREMSNGKDTLTGHWEMMGIKTEVAFPSFTDTGFPRELIRRLEEETKRKVIGNIAASGTEIIKNLGETQLADGSLIVYTSGDSVLQIAAHEEKIGLKELYKACEIARRLTIENDAWKVGRIIARPFIGTDKTNFTRTSNRHDYSLTPETNTLNFLQNKGLDVIGVGKISDIFNGSGITESVKTVDNHDGMNATLDLVKRTDWHGLCFVNLVDFDSKFGHRRDPLGYADAIEEFDRDLKPVLDNLKEDDLLIITADHGNDPIHHGSDHTREFIPVILYSKNKAFKPKVLGDIDGFSSIGVTISENFEVEKPLFGRNLLNE